MPHHKSCVKRIRIDKKRTLRNKIANSKMKTAVKKLMGTVKKEDAETVLKNTVSVIDKNVKAGILHKNCAANKKSKLTRYVNGLS